MTATQAHLPALPSLHTIEMEDRKRSLVNDVDDLAPSRKRLKDENGSTMRMAEDKEKDVEDFQKDAILRQMKEYRRQKKDAEDQLSELQKKTRRHNEHLRIIDAWFAQLLDEVRVLAGDKLPTPPPNATSWTGEELYKSALLFEDNDTFSDHLKVRSDGIKSAIADLFGRVPSASPDVESLKGQLNEVLAKEKEHVVELRQAIDEKNLSAERLEIATMRYLTAERKLDRAKSSQVLKLERQAIMGGNGDATTPTTSKSGATPKKEHSDTNGELENGVASAEAEAQRKEAIAAAEKQKAQLDEIEVENERLTNELSAARTKLASLSEDDYAETSLFKTLKSQYEDVIKRVNDLEATNVQLREEAQKYQSERAAYRNQMDDEARNQTSDIEAANARAETDLARVRHTRDQLSSEMSILKASEETPKTFIVLAQELAEAKDQRIAALESHVKRLEVQVGDAEVALGDLDDLDANAVKAKLRALHTQYQLLSNELPSMEAAWKKTQALASKKIDEVATWEEQVARLTAEKAKADQKYFAAMKAKDMRETELRTLKNQSSRSSEIVSQLKDGETKTKELCINLERQVADAKDSLNRIESQHRIAEQKLKEANTSAEGLKNNVDELKALIGAKDKETLGTAKAKRQAEEDLEKCKARLDDIKKQYDTLKKTRATVSSTSGDQWRNLAICPVCNANIRNTVLKLCGHVFCKSCITDLIQNRSRKCPTCGKAFGNGDHMACVLT